MLLEPVITRFLCPPRNRYLINRLRSVQLARSGSNTQESILVIRLDAIGDLVLTTPFLKELRRLAPQASITALVSPRTAGILKSSPFVDTVLPYDVPKDVRFSPVKHVQSIVDFAQRHLAHTNWSLAINPRWDEDNHDEAFLCFLSDAKRRVAYSEKVTKKKAFRNAGFDELYTDIIFEKSPPAHDRDRTVGVLKYIFPEAELVLPHLHLSAEDYRYAEEMLKPSVDAKLGRKRVIALGLGASTLRKTWPIESFIELTKLILKDHDSTIVTIGGPGEAAPGEMLAKAFPNNVIHTAGRSSLTQTAALLSRADVYVGNDTGPTHIAAAVSPAVIALFNHPLSANQTHVGSPARFRPLGPHVTVIQPAFPKPPCREACLQSTSHCITNISPAEVYATLLKIIEKSSQIAKTSR